MKGFDTDWMVKPWSASPVVYAIDGCEREAEQFRVGLAELGDVIGDLAALCLRDAPMKLGEIILNWTSFEGNVASVPLVDGLIHGPPLKRSYSRAHAEPCADLNSSDYDSARA
jgi:hypothetical protein